MTPALGASSVAERNIRCVDNRQGGLGNAVLRLLDLVGAPTTIASPRAFTTRHMAGSDTLYAAAT
jgi:hypothetical protein